MVSIPVTRICLIAVSLSCSNFGIGIASSVPRQASKALSGSHRNTVQLDGSLKPLVILRDALKQKPRASRFQVNWSMMVLSANYHSTALYDRNQHSLIFDCHGRWDGGGMHERAVYTRVTDDVISHAAKDHERDQSQVGTGLPVGEFRGYFEILPAYGATLKTEKHQDSTP